MSHQPKVSDARLKAALAKHDGMMALAAKSLKITRQSVQERVSRNPDIQAFIRDIGIAILDTAESQVAKKVRKGDGTTVRWLLDRKGRDRGYGPQPGDLPPPPDPNAHERRQMLVRVLVQNLEGKAAAVHVQVEEGKAPLGGQVVEGRLAPAAKALADARRGQKK